MFNSKINTLLISCALLCALNLVSFAQTSPRLPLSDDTRQTVEEFRRSNIKVTPQILALITKAQNLIAQEKFTEAIAEYKKIIAAKAATYNTYNNMAHCYSRLGNLDLAIQHFSMALKLSPENAISYTNRGIAYAQTGQFDAALADYNKSIELNPKEALFYNNRADLYSRIGNFDRALEDQNKAVSLTPTKGYYLSNRGMTYYRKGMYRQGNRRFR
jgi:Flp pilus assembly protein TadD